ncbi:DUF6233 domain-containing protein [Streptomyces sp. NPDC015171]|uniref:DUF6233 domain-containing protein n=1 Tax=Streptomyces sp. NPDC015171 TaxID=3364945 RepID=UPI0036FD01CB
MERWITAEEHHEAQRAAEDRKRRTADRLIRHGLSRANVDSVHVGDCWTARKSGRCRPASREHAMDALRQQVPAAALPPGHRAKPCPVNDRRRTRLTC